MLIYIRLHEFEPKFIVCKHPLCLDILGLDWKIQGQLYLHEDHIPLTYSKPSSSQDSAVFWLSAMKLD